MMRTETPTPIYLKDYTPPPFLVDTVTMDVDIRPEGTLVTTTQTCRRNPAAAPGLPLVLDGEDLETLAVVLDGRLLAQQDYQLEGESLTLSGLPDQFTLETRVRIQPDQNTQLSGFYRSKNGYFTQCEAQGFRRITWFQDRPDVMARYTVTLHGDKATYPELLANGNPVTRGEEDGGRHFATWEDPFKKPSYLFAMVAAHLEVLRDRYTTASGREVQLAVFVEPGKLDQCDHAMAALKKAMAWDEERFGLECDLDHYMIVAVGDFNMGAMENKGLNIFNTKYVLARPDVATDGDFENIDRVVTHEYCHNWTGDRVTCRDWFQLTLKEGLTVFRDQEFGFDRHNPTVARIREVRGLRAAQFPEDAGPMAHPIRPRVYEEINNFYTATVYEKGAEVIRMIQTLVGRDGFRKGLDLYFQRHDGQAVTCEDFVAAMADANGYDFAPFMTWYHQAGTPRLQARGQYDGAAQRYTLTLRQLPPEGGQPYLMPVALGLVGPDGQDMDLGGGATTRVLELSALEQSFVFEAIPAAPVPSLLRNFSAPVILEAEYSDAQLTHLLAHDSDPFNRWEAGQRLYGRLILDAVRHITQGVAPQWPESVAAAARAVLTAPDADPAFIAEALTLPTEATLAEAMGQVQPEALHAARNGLRRFLAENLESELLARYRALHDGKAYTIDSPAMARRALKNCCLAYLNELDDPRYGELAKAQFDGADNMTDQFAALAVLVNALAPAARALGETALAQFRERWKDEALVMDKWLSVQATSRQPDVLERVRALTAHPAFDSANPNKIYALIRSFGANHRHFHAADGSGYRFIAAWICRLDPKNPQVASRLARCFDRWKKFDPAHQAHAQAALRDILTQAGLSADVREVVGKALQ